MTAAQLIDRLRRDGCAVYRRVGPDACTGAVDVVVDCPSGVLTPDVRDALKRERDGIHAELQRQACEAVEPGRASSEIGNAPRGWSVVGWQAYAAYRADRCRDRDRAAWWRSQSHAN